MAKRIQIVRSKTGKEYQYDRDRKVFVKNGKIHQKNIDDYIKRIDKSNVLTPSEKTTLKNDLMARVKQYQQEGKTLSNYGFEGHRTKNSIDRMFANMGRSTEDIATEIGVPESALRDINNWSGDTFTYNNKT